jgi:hypothetical protein
MTPELFDSQLCALAATLCNLLRPKGRSFQEPCGLPSWEDGVRTSTPGYIGPIEESVPRILEPMPGEKSLAPRWGQRAIPPGPEGPGFPHESGEQGKLKPDEIQEWRWQLVQCYIYQAAVQLHLARNAMGADPWDLFLAAYHPAHMETRRDKRRGRVETVQGGPYGP